jgi:microcystin-dependent protein
MPRNGSGTYTLPNSAFVTLTTISSSAVNGNINDIGTALTQSVATTGVSTLIGTLPGFAGTISAPGYTFTNDKTSGWYRDSANTWGYSSSGVEVAKLSSAGVTMVSPAKLIDRSGTEVLGLPVGMMFDYAGTTAPTGWLLCNGQAVSQTTYSALFAIISTTYGNPGGGNFNLPDCRGRVTAALDSLGGTAANRLTNPVSNGVDGSAIANSGGLQNLTLVQGNIPNYTLSNNLAVTAAVSGVQVGSLPTLQGGGGTNVDSPTSSGGVGGTVTGSATTGGSSTPLNTVQPSLIVTKIIYTGIYP